MADSRSELQGSPTESYEAFAFKARREWIANYADIGEIRDILLTPPGEIYPYAPEYLAYCRSMSVAPFGTLADAGSGMVSYTQCIITAEYETTRAGLPDRDVQNPTEVISEEFQPTLEVWNIFTTENVRWKRPYKVNDVDTQTISTDQTPGLQVPGMNYAFTRYHVSQQLHPDVLRLKGSCNKYPVTSRNYGYTWPAQTLMYNQPLISTATLSDGSRRTTVAMYFTERAKPGWNYFFRPDLWDGTIEVTAPGTGWESAWDRMQVNVGGAGAWTDFDPVRPEDWSNLFV